MSYGGRLCGTKDVTDSYVETVGVVVGDAVMEPGESGYFAHNLGTGAIYTGTLEVLSMGSGGAVLKMPDNAQSDDIYAASWVARCGITASVTVTTGSGDSCASARSSGCGAVPPYVLTGPGGACATVGAGAAGWCPSAVGCWMTEASCASSEPMFQGRPCLCKSHSPYVSGGPSNATTYVLIPV